jgi:endonuclease/exonuclease/phosphatase (EEP) superfamily protein YafD
VFGVLAAWNAILVAPFLVARPKPPIPGQPSLKLVVANVHRANPDHERFINFIRRESPGLFVVVEVDDQWLHSLEDLHRDYPFRIEAGREDDFGIALFSRSPVTASNVVEFLPDGVPSVHAQFVFDGATVDLLGTHPLPPVGTEYSAARNAQLVAIGAWVAGRTNDLIVVGDLNVTPWSRWFGELTAGGRLRTSARDSGLQPTWPVRPAIARIPIDHCLISPNWRVTRYERGPDVGSDHFPLVIELQRSR